MSTTPLENEFAGAAGAIIGGPLGSGPVVVRAFAARGARILVGELAHHTLSDAERAACAPSVATAAIDVADPASIARFYEQCEQQQPQRSVLQALLETVMPSASEAHQPRPEAI